MSSTSVIELSKPALIHNTGFIRKILGPETRLSAVVKGNAYGHGIEIIVPVLEKTGVDHFSVFSTDEAFRVRKIKKPGSSIMIMGWIPERDMDWVIENGIEFYVYDHEVMKKLIPAAKKRGKPARIHIELETGLHRTGFDASSLPGLFRWLKENERLLRLKGICTHYAGPENIANHVRIQKQISKFNRMMKKFTRQGPCPEICHTACSAASINYPRTRMDMARVGILLYGYWPSPETMIQYFHHTREKDNPLRRVLTWKTRIMTIKHVKEGEFIGYGTSFFTQDRKTIAVIPVGYVHGFSRILSNNGRVLIRGQQVPVVGNVNMNMLIADITQVPDVRTGDEVVLIGNQGEQNISVASFSEMNNLLNYELLTRLPENIDRVLVDN